MLYDIVYLLPYKLECYKSVVNALYENRGMACDDLTINVFNADCGIDSIAFVCALINKGYKIEDIIKPFAYFRLMRRSLNVQYCFIKSYMLLFH